MSDISTSEVFSHTYLLSLTLVVYSFGAQYTHQELQSGEANAIEWVQKKWIVSLLIENLA